MVTLKSCNQGPAVGQPQRHNEAIFSGSRRLGYFRVAYLMQTHRWTAMCAGDLMSRVFVVDDEPAITFTLAAILRLNGYDVQSFVNPLEALEAIAGNRPDLLISDVMMPEMSGVDLAVRLKKDVRLARCCCSPVKPRLPARENGHDFELLRKPVHPADLLARV